jgi:cytochrome c oxidase subunit 2
MERESRSWAGVVSPLVAMALSLFASAAMAASGQPSPKEIGFQEAATPIFEEIHAFHYFVNIIIFSITAFVMVLLLYVIFRFNEKRNPVPSKNTHNTTLEVLWTVVPVFILVIIAIPSFKLLYAEYTYPPPDVVLKATGNTWNWSYEFPDIGVRLDAVMLQDNEREELIKAGMPADQVPRNLAVSNEVLVPVNKVVHVLVTSSDVIHAWRVPSFGSMVDAVPGRINATWFKALKEGIYFGQCSELCGKDHAFMPIAVRAVKDSVFNDWAKAVKDRKRDRVRQIILEVAKEQAGQNKTALR